MVRSTIQTLALGRVLEMGISTGSGEDLPVRDGRGMLRVELPNEYGEVRAGDLAHCGAYAYWG